MDYDNVCAVCGASLAWQDCWDCEGASELGVPGDMEECDECHGEGGWPFCQNCVGRETPDAP